MEEKSIFKKVSTLIGGIATHAISGSILYYYTFLPYRFSYLKRLNIDLKSISLSYIIPVSLMFMYGFSWLGAFLERKINARVYILIDYIIDHYLLVIFVLLLLLVYFGFQKALLLITFSFLFMVLE